MDSTYFYNLSENEKNYQSGRMEIKEFFTPNLDYFGNQEIVKIVFFDENIPHLNKIEKEMQNFL